MNTRLRYSWMAIVLFSAAFSGYTQNFTIHFFDKSGQMKWTNALSQGVYQVEWRRSLTQGDWQTNGSPSIALSDQVISVNVPVSETQRYFRVAWNKPAQPLYSVSGAVYYLDVPLSDLAVLLHASSDLLGATTFHRPTSLMPTPGNGSD